MAVDFSLSPEQTQVRAEARDFAGRVLTTVKRAIAGISAADQRFYALRPFYQEMVRAGFLRGLIPPAAGGTYTGLLDQVIGGEEMAAVDINLPCTIFSSGLGLQPLIQFGTEEQHRRLLGPFIDATRDPLAALAFTEVEGAANFDDPAPTAGIQTTARLDGDEWVINGSKQFTTNATGWDGRGAELFTVVCRTDPTAPPRESLAVIAVAGRPDGIRVDGWLDTIGHRAALSPRVHFENVRVPAENLIGAPGDGIKILDRTFSWSAPMVGSGSVGLMRAAFDAALAFAKGDRRLGSVPVIEHQNAGYMLADIKSRLEAARYLTWKAAHYYDSTGGMGQEAGVIAKVFCSETAVQVIYDAMRLVGIQSYVSDHPLAGLIQDALALPLYDGGNMGIRPPLAAPAHRRGRLRPPRRRGGPPLLDRSRRPEMTTPEDQDLPAITGWLRDRVEIVDAVYRFAVGQDFHDSASFESAFTEDAVLDFSQPPQRFGVSVPPMVGRRMIRERAFPEKKTLVVTHTITNERVSIDGDEATLHALVEAQHVVPEKPDRHFLLKNLYDVRLRRAAPAWRMTYLRIENLWFAGDASVLFQDLSDTPQN